MRFVKGKYSFDHSWAMLIEFVVDGQPAPSIQRIYTLLAAMRKKIRMRGNWEREMHFGNYQNLYKTRHYQPKKQSLITILHLFLTVPIASTSAGKEQDHRLSSELL